MNQYILSLDQGTTSSRAIIFDRSGKIVALAQKEFNQYYPQSGWVEHNPKEIWSTQLSVATEAVANAGLKASSIAAIGITNQRETTIIWDRRTGQAIYPAIVWQDRRTAAYCDELKEKGLGDTIRQKTGLLIDAYFSASKIHWILKHVAGAYEKAKNGQLAFGTVDAWLIWNLTGGEKHLTDVTNASRTMLYNIHTLEWDDELLELFDIPRSLLPEVRSSSEIYGETAASMLATRIPIAGIAGDQHAALFGQLCTKTGMVKNTYGTGCFMLMNIGDKPILSANNLVTTIAWKLGDKVSYALEGSIFIGGAIVQWLRDGLGIIRNSADVETLAKSVSDTDGVYLVPAFAGLGAPHWDPYARGTIVGLTRGSTAAHIARAALEGIAFQTVDILRAMEADAGVGIKELRVDGGATANNLLLQLQADILQALVVRPQITETTAIGAAYLAGLAVGFWQSVDDIQSQWQINQTFAPDASYDAASAISRWHRAVETAKTFK
ncbi:glycerol kinase GlpK [Parapedobacter sp. ISTM3]|uniref:Glycerol kinase n=1 Tax=Parapedobacter luteus TaxID=623280 RepID=A0A1T5EY62_9SPHI|nr:MULTISPECIES: glycerol kinase GlpK [Parapedobacter]MBK1441496.1 glycerol kinase GlpK [Parapedobacter sp. ISTM3]SKB88877.1 glycerol kinase [Parapedobacter luteus]